MKKDVLTELNLPDYPVLSEKDYASQMDTTVMPQLNSIREEFRLTAKDGHVIYGEAFRLTENTRGTILISHGCTESCVKYHELDWYFLKEGFDVVIIDHRGHSRSKDGNTGIIPTHVEHFSDYIDDLHVTVEQVLKTHPAPYCLYAHSMGGLIGAMYLEEHPGVFQRAILNAPMFEINRGGIPYWTAKAAANLLCLLGKGNGFLMGQGTFREQEDFPGCAADSYARYLYYFRQQLADPWLRNNGSSCRWVKESFLAGEKALKQENCGKVTIPVLLFQAEKDDYVLPGGQDKFISNIPNGRTVFVPGSKHEVYMGQNKLLGKYMTCVMDFLKQ